MYPTATCGEGEGEGVGRGEEEQVSVPDHHLHDALALDPTADHTVREG